MAEENINWDSKSDSEMLSYFRYIKLQKLLDTQKDVLCHAFTTAWHLSTMDFNQQWEDRSENRQQFITGIGKQVYDHASGKQKEDLARKKICEWDVPLLVQSVKCFKNDIIDSNLRYDVFQTLEVIRQKVDGEMFEIDEAAYAQYFEQIENLLKKIDAFQPDIDRFKPLTINQVSEQSRHLKAILQNIHTCKDLGLIAQLGYGPTFLDAGVIYHIENLLTKPVVENPAILSMISAGQEVAFGDGRKFVFIFCGALLNSTKHLLEKNVCSINELSECYKFSLDKALEILPTLTCYEIKNYDQQEIFKGLRASIMSKHYGQELKLAELIAKACNSVISENTIFDVNKVRIRKSLGGDFSNSEIVPEMVLEGVLTEKREFGDLIFEDKIEDISAKIFQIGVLSTIVLRGPDENKVNDFEKAIYNGINIFKAITTDGRLVPGAGATEIELAEKMNLFAKNFTGLKYLVLTGFANALIELPRALVESTRAESGQIALKLLQAHKCGEKNVGFFIQGEGTLADVVANGIFDLYLTKYWGLKTAVNAAINILNLNTDHTEMAD